MSRERPRDRLGRPLPAGSADELGGVAEPATIDEAIDRAAGLFDDERFFEAHELFESVWKSPHVDPTERRFWKGVTQVAVGCCHVQRGNARGARALLRRAAGYLEARTIRRVDGTRLIRLTLDVASKIEREGIAAVRAFPRLPRS